VNMYSHMLPRNKPNSVWLISDDVDNMLYSTTAAASTLPSSIFTEPGEGEQYGRIFGRSVIPVEQALPIGNRGDITLVDLSDYIIADRAMETDVSLHVRFLNDEMVFRFTYRVDGQPALRTPITPYQGTDIKSAYVALGAR
jgi:HK97 family phage major capsid protein